jgi:hypothetical protein
VPVLQLLQHAAKGFSNQRVVIDYENFHSWTTSSVRSLATSVLGLDYLGEQFLRNNNALFA